MNRRVWEARQYGKDKENPGVATTSYYDGYVNGLKQAALLLEELSPLEGRRLGLLIRAIGTAEVTEDGQHKAMLDD